MPPHASTSKTKSAPKTVKVERVRFDSATAHILVLVVIAIMAYANSLNGAFVFDDQQIVLQNAQLMNVHTLGDAFAIGAGWRQLLFFTYGLNYYFSGTDTFTEKQSERER